MTTSAEYCLNLVRDAFGNGLVGDAERGMRYLELAAKGLELHVELLKDRNNRSIEKQIRDFHQGLGAALDSFPPLDMSDADESMKRFADAGIESVLPSLDPSILAMLPQNLQPGANAVAFKGEDAKKFIAGLAG